MERKPCEFWEQHVRGFEGSGQTRRAYCAAHGLSRSTLDAWRRRLVAERGGTGRAGFVPLVPHAPARSSLSVRWPSGAELVVPRDCDPLWLAQVLSGAALMLRPRRWWLAVEPIDLRCGIDRLLVLIQTVFGGDAFDGSAYVFRNHSGSRIKLVLGDATGVWLCVRRLHEGGFIWPRAGDALCAVDASSSSGCVQGWIGSDSRCAQKAWPQADGVLEEHQLVGPLHQPGYLQVLAPSRRGYRWAGYHPKRIQA